MNQGMASPHPGSHFQIHEPPQTQPVTPPETNIKRRKEKELKK